MSSKDIKVIVKGRFIHQLMTSADNTGNSATITREFVYTKSRSFTTKTFHESVSSVAKKQSQSAGTRFETSGSYGVVSASVSGEYSINNELEEMLQETNRSETTLDVQLTTTETQKYPVGPHSKLYVYYRYFEGPGMKASTPVPVTRPAPMPDQELTEEVDIEVVLTPMPLLKRLHIVSSRLGTEAPADRIRERFGKNDNINHDQGGIHVWLVPEMTKNAAEALTHIDLVVTPTRDERCIDLGTGSKDAKYDDIDLGGLAYSL